MDDRIIDLRAAAHVPVDPVDRVEPVEPPPRRRRSTILLAIVLGMIIVGPAVSDLVQAVTANWRPLGDNVIILRRALDVGGARNPTLGMPSSFTVWTGEASYHPGPMVFWLFAPITRLTGTGGPWSLAVVALVRVVAGFGIVFVPAKLGGRRMAVAAGIALACGGATAPPLFEPLNPQVAALPLALLPFLCWAVVCGRRRAVPAAALVTSFVVQADLAFAPTTAALLAVVTAVAVGRWRREGRTFLLRNRRAATWAAVVVAVCWVEPVIEAIRHGGGNLRAIVRATAKADIPSAGLSGVLGGSALLVVIATVAALVWWSRRPRAIERAIAPIGAAVLVGFVATLWLQPTTGEVSGQHAIFAPTIFLVFTVVAAAMELAHAHAGRMAPAGAGAMAVVLLLGAVTATAQPTTLPHRASYGAAELLAADVGDRLDELGYDRVVLRNPGAFPVRDVGITVATELEARGVSTFVSGGYELYLGSRRDADLVPHLPEVWIVDGRAPEPPVAGAVAMATWTPDEEEAREMAAIDQTIVDTVNTAGGITLTDRADVVVPPILQGWPDVEAAFEKDPSSLKDAPAPILESLYSTGIVTSPALPWDTYLALGEHRACHRIVAYLVS